MIEDLPEELVRLWRLGRGSHRGRPAGLDVDRVVHTAIQLADRAGLAAATLPKIADELGVTAMSLYRHIGSKEELLVLMGDAATGTPRYPFRDDADWLAALHDWALALRAVYHSHPWLIQLPISGPPRGPNAIAWIDAGLRALRETTLDPGAKVNVLTVVSGYVRQADLLHRQLEQGRAASGLTEAQTNAAYGRELARLIDPERFPHAAELVASGLFEVPPPTVTDDFTFGLELVLDGVAAAVERSAGGTAH
ncbi:TetR/AcrR family transcriptional regulator [Nocardia amamiensis]|uniref:TetR/AcrR family transcriptional regulator n=1 Tax=Nocardia amamiensis TaxID=404578 RepID=UPI0008370DFC|nr:TetR/AcrR family transcriptional regulator [Nocardia amamiensis]